MKSLKKTLWNSAARFRPPDRRKYPCGIRGMSLKTKNKGSLLGPYFFIQFSSPCGAVRRSTYLASGNEFKNLSIIQIIKKYLLPSFRPPDQREYRVQTEGSLLGDRRKCPCGIRGMSLKTKFERKNLKAAIKCNKFSSPLRGMSLKTIFHHVIF